MDDEMPSSERYLTQQQLGRHTGKEFVKNNVHHNHVGIKTVDSR
jgi:hypothetical protein